MPIIRIQNLNGSREFNYFAGEPEPDWIIEPGDLLFAWAGSKGSSFGPCIWPGPRGVLNQHIHKLSPHEGVDKRFLYYLLKVFTAQVEKHAHGFKDSLVHLRKAVLTELVVNVPPFSVQQSVARRLLTLDEREERELGYCRAAGLLKKSLGRTLLQYQ